MPGHDEVTASMYIYKIVFFSKLWGGTLQPLGLLSTRLALQYVYTIPIPRTFNIYTLISAKSSP